MLKGKGNVKAKAKPKTKAKIDVREKVKSYLKMSLLIGVIYALYCIYYWVSVARSGMEVGTGLAIALIVTHLAATFMAVIFNALALWKEKRKFALAGAILYTAALVSFPVYFMFVVVEMVLCYMSFAKMPKMEEKKSGR